MRLILAAAFIAAPLAAVAADDPLEAAVKARQGFFTLLGANMGTLAGMAKGEIAYDEAAASRAASNIEALSGYDASIHFPAGTARGESMAETEASPKIWSDMEGFGKAFMAMAEAADGAGEAVKGGRGNLGARLQMLGKSCKGCHDDYREKN